MNTAEWNTDGDLRSWKHSHSLGWGWVYGDSTWGEGDVETGRSSQILRGLFGYSEDRGHGYLKLLWIPIPIKG